MPDFQQYPEPMVFHQALISVIPSGTDVNLKFSFAIDGEHAGIEEDDDYHKDIKYDR